MQDIWDGKGQILITGAAGFVGSHLAQMLDALGCRTLLVDRQRNPTLNVQHGLWIEEDLKEVSKIKEIFNTFDIEAVMHFAAFIDVGESVIDPAKYYKNNVVNTLNLLELMKESGILHFIFSSSAAIFGEPEQLPISETHPCRPINPYGESKLIIEKVLRDFETAYGLKSISLRYFNAAGGDSKGIIKNDKKKESNLIPIALKSLQSKSPVTIFGTDYPTPDGTCIRDYIHVEDIGNAHILALKKLLYGKKSVSYNLGNGKGYSVKEVIRAIEKVTGQKLLVIEGPRRPGDVPVLLADSKKAQAELDWHPHYSDLETMIAHAWKGYISDGASSTMTNPSS